MNVIEEEILDLTSKLRTAEILSSQQTAESAEMKELCKERDGQLALLREQADSLRDQIFKRSNKKRNALNRRLVCIFKLIDKEKI